MFVSMSASVSVCVSECSQSMPSALLVDGINKAAEKTTVVAFHSVFPRISNFPAVQGTRKDG